MGKSKDLREAAVAYKETGKVFGVSASIAAAKLNNKIIAPMQYSGTMNPALFEMWFEKWLLPCLEKGMTIVMDNVSITHLLKMVKGISL